MAEEEPVDDSVDRDNPIESDFAGPMMASAQFAEAIDTLRRNHADALGVPISDMLAMSFILQSGSATPKAIGNHLQMSTGTITALLDRLEQQGILTRNANPDDRRSTLITLTPKGATAITGDWVDFEQRIASVAQARTPAELETVTGFLSELAAALRR